MCVHAEINAIIRCEESWRTLKKLYITTYPCYECCKALANFNVKIIIYKNNYREQGKSYDFLKTAKIKTRKI